MFSLDSYWCKSFRTLYWSFPKAVCAVKNAIKKALTRTLEQSRFVAIFVSEKTLFIGGVCNAYVINVSKLRALAFTLPLAKGRSHGMRERGWRVLVVSRQNLPDFPPSPPVRLFNILMILPIGYYLTVNFL